jgi:hypothetical protein
MCIYTVENFRKVYDTIKIAFAKLECISVGSVSVFRSVSVFGFFVVIFSLGSVFGFGFGFSKTAVSVRFSVFFQQLQLACLQLGNSLLRCSRVPLEQCLPLRRARFTYVEAPGPVSWWRPLSLAASSIGYG